MMPILITPEDVGRNIFHEDYHFPFKIKGVDTYTRAHSGKVKYVVSNKLGVSIVVDEYGQRYSNDGYTQFSYERKVWLDDEYPAHLIGRPVLFRYDGGILCGEVVSINDRLIAQVGLGATTKRILQISVRDLAPLTEAAALSMLAGKGVDRSLWEEAPGAVSADTPITDAVSHWEFVAVNSTY